MSASPNRCETSGSRSSAGSSAAASLGRLPVGAEAAYQGQVPVVKAVQRQPQDRGVPVDADITTRPSSATASRQSRARRGCPRTRTRPDGLAAEGLGQRSRGRVDHVVRAEGQRLPAPLVGLGHDHPARATAGPAARSAGRCCRRGHQHGRAGRHRAAADRVHAAADRLEQAAAVGRNPSGSGTNSPAAAVTTSPKPPKHRSRPPARRQPGWSHQARPPPRRRSIRARAGRAHPVRRSSRR